ncbi:MAG: hypothetical protein ACE14V_03545 [bacterium]
MSDIYITIIIALIGTLVTFWVGYISAKQIKKHGVDISENFKNTSKMISQITGLFAASQMVGINTAYENRGVALLERDAQGNDAQSFLRYLKEEPKLIVVGSTLLGLRMYVTKLAQYLRDRKERNYETKFLLTHPCFSSLREDQEKRSAGEIGQELEDSIRFLKNDCGLELNTSIRFYKGTPTCFMIITSNAMLLNPYPYQTEAFKSFCLEVRRIEKDESKTETMISDILNVIDSDRFRNEIEGIIRTPEWKKYDYSYDKKPDIYGQFYWYHYFLPWYSKQVVTYAEFEQICKKCTFVKGGLAKQCQMQQTKNP